MSRGGVFGWSYPAGCSGPPEMEEAPYFIKCSGCGGFLKFKADRTEEWKSELHCDGVGLPDLLIEPMCGEPKEHEPHTFVADWGTTFVRVCARCKKENRSDK